MLVVSQLLWALFCIHAFWFYCFITGTLVRLEPPSPNSDHGGNHDSHHMADLVITSTTGLAITGFVVLLLGFIGILNIAALLVWLGLEVLLFKLLKRENVFGLTFWTSRLRKIKRAWSSLSLIIYLVFLVISVPAILPPTLWDSTSYHLAYAVDWANAGRIYADEFLRFPYYANNFILIYALMFAMKLGQLSHFATWLCGLLSGLGVYAFVAQNAIKRHDQDRLARIVEGVKALVLPLTLALSATFLRYVNVGYIDVPMGLFLLVPILCTYLILKGSTRNYEIDLVITAAFCVGMKISLFLCLPLFLFSIVLVVRRQRTPLRRALTLSALLIVLSAPWYLRNFISVGDPIPPTLNLMIRGRDRIFTQADYADLMIAVRAPLDTSALLLAPIKLFRQPDTDTHREYGNNLSVVLLYLPLATLLMMAFRSFRRRVGAGFIYLNIALVYLLINWVGISALGRYFLHLFPVYLGYLGVCFTVATQYVHEVLGKKRSLRWAFQAALLLLLVALPYPTSSSHAFYFSILNGNYFGLPATLENQGRFLCQTLPGYLSAQTIMNALYASGNPHRRVLTVKFENLAFYFRERNIVSVGDWFGPGRFSDLITAVENDEVAEYLSRFEIGAVMINRRSPRMDKLQHQRFVRQLELNHFTLYPGVEPGTDVYIKSN